MSKIHPKIDLASIPGLDSAQALFGTASDRVAAPMDEIVAILVYVYDVNPPADPDTV